MKKYLIPIAFFLYKDLDCKIRVLTFALAKQERRIRESGIFQQKKRAIFERLYNTTLACSTGDVSQEHQNYYTLNTNQAVDKIKRIYKEEFDPGSG